MYTHTTTSQVEDNPSCESSKSRVMAVCPMHQSGVKVAPQPMCKLKSVTGALLDKVADWIPTRPEVPFQTEEDALECINISAGGGMGRSCLCDTVRPILKLSELLGVIPMRVFHPTGESGFRTGSCQLVFQWRSLGALVNTVLILGFVGFLPFSFRETKTRMRKVFKGTDLYAFTLQFVALVFETTVLLVSGRFLRCRFMKGWAELNEVYHEMCDAASDLKRIKVGTYMVTIIIILKLIVFSVCTFWATYSSSAFDHWSMTALATLILNLTWFIPYTLSTMFFSICILIRSHFITISDMLRSILKNPSTPKLCTKIDAIRILHEQLCQAVSDFETFFGIQILLTLCTGCFSVTVGVYAYIVQGEGISTSKAHESAALGMQLYNAVIFMLLILIGGQLVTNSASSPAPVLNSLSLTVLDEKSQFQVAAFLQKIAAFPTRMSALKITNVSTTFLSSAATNIITYLLVLMQFKLSLEKSFCDQGCHVSQDLDEGRNASGVNNC